MKYLGNDLNVICLLTTNIISHCILKVQLHVFLCHPLNTEKLREDLEKSIKMVMGLKLESMSKV